MSSPFQKKFCGKTPDPIKMLGDLNKDGKMSSYEQTRQDAIEANSPTNYGSPLDQRSYSVVEKQLPKITGYYNPEFEPHPSEKLPTRPENQAKIDAVPYTFEQMQADKKFDEMLNKPLPTDKKAKREFLAERANLAGKVYQLGKPKSDAVSEMLKQKRKDYKTILKAGETIAKNM